MRQFFRIFPATELALACALMALVSVWAAPAHAQETDDDLYGVPASAPTSDPEAEASPKKVAAPDSTIREPGLDSAAAPTVSPPVVAPLDTARPAPRPRIVRETTVNPLDTRRGNYRNPKKALFMSLMVPGLGQAYVGQNAFNYSRAVLYFGTEITLGMLWYNYTVVKYDREVKRYRRFADVHWSQAAYEDAAFNASGAATFEDVNDFRTSYCDAVQNRESAEGAALYRGCINLLIPDSAASNSYQNFRSAYADKPTPEEVGAFRASFADPVDFYALIGRYQEFVGGWDDVTNLAYTPDSIAGSSANRTTYAGMRRKAQEYSRMQAWFIGGIALNHIASAIDAAITARRNNRHLYEGAEARWYDRVGIDGGLAFDGGRPFTHMVARLSF